MNDRPRAARASLRVLALACALHLASAPPLRACGHCLEDRIAAVYDHAMVLAARARHHPVVYVAIGTPGVDTPRRLLRVRRELAATPGVDPGSVRTDVGAAAAAFSFDPARLPGAGLMARVRSLAGRGVSCDTLRVDRR